MNTLIKSIKNTNECVWYCLLTLKGVCKIQVLIQADPYCRVPQNWLIISLLKQSVRWKSMVSGRWWQSFTVSTKYIKYLPVFYWGFVSLFFSRQTKTPQSHRERDNKAITFVLLLGVVFPQPHVLACILLILILIITAQLAWNSHGQTFIRLTMYK